MPDNKILLINILILCFGVKLSVFERSVSGTQKTGLFHQLLVRNFKWFWAHFEPSPEWKIKHDDQKNQCSDQCSQQPVHQDMQGYIPYHK
jgi:hypothetical protein